MGVHLVRGRQREQWRERGSRLLELEQHGLERERELRVSDLLPHTHIISLGTHGALSLTPW